MDLDISRFRRDLRPGQDCVVFVHDTRNNISKEVYRTRDVLLEAPNWTKDDHLILNGDFVLWRLVLADGTLSRISSEGLPEVNNDHVLAPNDHSVLYVSCFDFHLHRLDLLTGEHVRLTENAPGLRSFHFLHGVAPEGDALAYVGFTPGEPPPGNVANIYILNLPDGEVKMITSGTSPADGCEFSPDGEWIYFNTEEFSVAPGHAQIARIRPSGEDLEQLTSDNRVNWFPHLAPRGDLACYLSFPPNTLGHPADLEVEVKLVRGKNWQRPETVARILGGQGTINVNSWSPCGHLFAYVAYPLSQTRTA